MFLVIQIGAVLVVVAYLTHFRMRLVQRNRQSWESLVARLRPSWGGEQSSRHYLWLEGITVEPDELWANIGGAHGIWALFKNAGVMMEMADFAERNCKAIDQELLQRLRSDAMQVRKCALAVLVQWATKTGSDTVRIKAFQAASMYTGMTARMVQMIERSAGEVLPEFVAAM